ncbi:MAG: polysaccharide biosynthesis tyrosine autokinase [Deltaproteobacteria bacterium]|nr:polysaccharide biosynthesis tyrosine autokinase [Deltaproteobacteria bacterium]
MVEAPQTADARDESSLSLERAIEFGRLLLRRKWLILLVAAGVSTGTFFWTDSQIRIFAAKTTVEINTQTPQVITNVREVVELGTGGYWASKEFFQTQYQVIRSRAVAERVVRAEGLARDLDFLGLKELEGTPRLAEALKRTDPVSRLVGATRVEPVRDSRVVAVVVEDSEPTRAQRLSIAVAEAYREFNVARKGSTTQDALAKLVGAVPGLEQKLASAERVLSEFRVKHGFRVPGFEDNLRIQSEKLQSAWKKYQEVTWSRNSLEKELAELKKLNGDWANPEVSSAVLQNALVQRLKADISEIDRRYKKLLERYQEKYQDVRDVKKELETARAALTEEVAKFRKNRNVSTKEREANLRALQKLEREAHVAFQRDDSVARQLTAREADYSGLLRDVKYSEMSLSRVLQRIKEIELTKDETQIANNVTVLDRAQVPRAPVRPRFMVNLAVGLVLGIVLGVFLAMLLNSLDTSVRTQEQVEALTGATFLGIVPLVRNARVAKSPPARSSEVDPQSFVSEAVRAIRTNLFFMSPDKPLRSIVVTSSGPEEGKTTVACNLATSVALTGKRVVLVDTDMRRPNIHRVYGKQNDKGISSLILMDIPLEEVLVDSGIPHLSLLLCGPVPPNPSELLQSARFKKVFELLVDRFDMVIYDSPPSLVVADALLLATVCDGTVLVANGARTARESLRRSTRQLRALKAHLLGTILNSVDLEDRRYGYYYHYGYTRRYGYYSRPGTAESSPSSGPDGAGA